MSEIIGRRIANIRKHNGLTQADLASKLNISSKTVSSWEIGRTEPNMGDLSRMCEIFGCKMEYFSSFLPDNFCEVEFTKNLKEFNRTPDVSNYNYEKIDRYLDIITDTPTLASVLTQVEKLSYEDKLALQRMLAYIIKVGDKQ